MVRIKQSFASLGRVLLSSIFILSAINKILQWQQTESGLINLFCDWQSYVSGSDTLSRMFSTLVTWAPEILITMTAIELIAALLVFFGIKEKFAAFLLIIFFIPTTILLHPFWFFVGLKKAQQLVMFLKNFAILGGLFMLMVFGSKVSGGSSFQDKNAGDEE
ncbi:MAG: DoxX family protein [Parachlamydiales bacterium]|jgi:uncharacterized membrane protein YphA (DoxX/SURF4 family)